MSVLSESVSGNERLKVRERDWTDGHLMILLYSSSSMKM